MRLGLLSAKSPFTLHMLEKEFERNYEAHRGPNDPPTFAEFKAMSLPNTAARVGIRFIQRIIDDPKVGEFFNELRVDSR